VTIGRTDDPVSPAQPGATTDPAVPVIAAGPFLDRGAVVDRYVVLEKVGAGGMGVVYAAFDPQLDRKVALKLLRHPGADAAAARSQLAREAQALARLSHPNVVTVHDIGSWNEQLFLAMEFIDGWTVRSWLDERRPGAAEVLRVLVAAGRGLAAAHAAGIVHRDFKPDNVLVGRGGRACVSDFGLARSAPVAVAGPAAEARNASSIAGTPRYMAPEQRAGRPADARSDQYSYCLTLWEALHGELPPATGGRTPRRGARLRRVLARGASADPAARWSSMTPLLDALERTGQRRRPWGLAAVLVLASALVGVRWLGERRAELCRGGAAELAAVWNDGQRNRIQAALADEGEAVVRVLDDYGRGWTAMHEEACAATRLHGHQTEEVMGLRMGCLSSRLDEARALIGVLARGAVPLDRARSAAQSLAPVAECADVAALSAPVRPPSDPAVRARVDGLRRELAEAKAVYFTGRLPEVAAQLGALYEAARAVGYGPLFAEIADLRGRILTNLGNDDEAAASLYEAAYAAEASGHDAVAAQAWVELVEVVGYEQDQPAAAQRITRQAEAAVARLRGRRPDIESRLYGAQSGLAERDGDLVRAEELAGRAVALAPDDRHLAIALINHAWELRLLGRYPAAVAESERALALNEALYGPGHREVALARFRLGAALADLGRTAEAIVEQRRAIAILESRLEPDSLEIAEYSVGLGRSLSRAGDHAAALAAFERALPVLDEKLGTHEDVADAHGRMAEALLAARRWAEARARAEHAVAIQEQVGPRRRPMVSWLAAIATAELALGRGAAAVAAAERALALGAELGLPEPELAPIRLVRAFGQGPRRAPR
jgi:serine/threonine protein kinase